MPIINPHYHYEHQIGRKEFMPRFHFWPGFEPASISAPCMNNATFCKIAWDSTYKDDRKNLFLESEDQIIFVHFQQLNNFIQFSTIQKLILEKTESNWSVLRVSYEYKL